VRLFVEEIDVVRRELGLDRLQLLGQSWDGMLALEYALTQPVGVASLTLHGDARVAHATHTGARRGGKLDARLLACRHFPLRVDLRVR